MAKSDPQIDVTVYCDEPLHRADGCWATYTDLCLTKPQAYRLAIADGWTHTDADGWRCNVGGSDGNGCDCKETE